jgi:hypothetical protein
VETIVQTQETNTNTLKDFINYLLNQLVQEENKLEKLGIQCTKQQNKVDDMNKIWNYYKIYKKIKNKKNLSHYIC